MDSMRNSIAHPILAETVVIPITTILIVILIVVLILALTGRRF